MAGDEKSLRIEERAETLRDAQHNAADERAPERSRPADHRRLEGEDELRRSGIRVECRAHTEKSPGDRDRRQCDCGGDRIDAPRVDADQPDRVRILGGGADRASDQRSVEKGLDSTEQHDRNRHRERRELADRNVAAERPTVIGEVTDVRRERACVGAETLEQKIVENDRQPEGREHRNQQSAARAALEHQPLERPADHGHEWDHEAKAEKRLHAETISQNEERVSREHRKAAVREVDDAHDAEHERQAAGDERIIATEQNALNDLVGENQGCGASARDDFLRPK